jgi:hypothetical protein
MSAFQPFRRCGAERLLSTQSRHEWGRRTKQPGARTGTLSLRRSLPSMARPTFDKPSEVVADKGRVLVDGPDSVDVALTPEAALETGGRLLDQAAQAAGQRRETKIDHRPK